MGSKVGHQLAPRPESQDGASCQVPLSTCHWALTTVDVGVAGPDQQVDRPVGQVGRIDDEGRYRLVVVDGELGGLLLLHPLGLVLPQPLDLGVGQGPLVDRHLVDPPVP